MECQSKSSHKYLLLQVWCGLLTVAVVVMVAFLSSIKPKSTEHEVSTLQPEISPTVNTIAAPLKSIGSSLSYIQLIKSPDDSSWQDSQICESCFLALRDDSVHCTKDSIYFVYAQVTFCTPPVKHNTKSVLLIVMRDDSVKKLAEGIYPGTTESSVWVGKIVTLKEGDRVSINITGNYRRDSTVWGAFQLH